MHNTKTEYATLWRGGGGAIVLFQCVFVCNCVLCIVLEIDLFAIIHNILLSKHKDGILEISVCQDGEAVLTIVGDQGNEWHEHNMTVSCGDNPVQVYFILGRLELKKSLNMYKHQQRPL